ncbi:MAG: hypothetical protein LBC98_00700 [Prevotellaceae bacterium]|jgi:hypothetical protein|nr:hypothetical protein [Prevotellaceae bacterium]
MTVINIDETTEIGRDILRQVIENPKAGKLRDFEFTFDEDDELDDFPHFSEEELNRMRAEILADGPDDEIPCDENGDPIGYTWEETREMMYKILSRKNVDVRTS